MTRRVMAAALLCALSVLAGCRNGSSNVHLDDLVPLTADALSLLLVGPPPEQRATVTTNDPPLMKRGVYETALIAADADAFARESRGAVSVKDIAGVQKSVVEKVNDRLKKEGFHAKTAPYPFPGGAEPKSLLCVLTPAVEEAGSPADRANGKGRKLILVVVTVTDPATGTVLAERRYYSGADARRP